MIYGLSEKERTIMKAIIVISLIIAFVLVLAINDTRVSLEKGYGIMTPIANFEVGVEDILNAINYKPKIHAHWVNEGFLDMYCSHCGETPDSESGSCPTPTDFCPYCGAEMGGDSE